MPSDHYLGDGPNPAQDLALGEGRQITEDAADTSVTLTHNVEGGLVGDTVQVSADRAAWLIANGKAVQPDRFTDQYAKSRRPATGEDEGEAGDGEDEGAAGDGDGTEETPEGA